MIRRMIQWLRVAAPPRWTPQLLLPAFVFEAIYLWHTWHGARLALAQHLLRTRDIVLLIAAIILGACRVWNSHPLYQQDYRNWLRLTPWTSRMPLPLGPIHLAPQDLVWLGLALLVWHDPQFSRLYLPLGFLFAYLFMICVSCWPTGSMALGYLLVFGLGEIVRQWADPLRALTTAGWLYLAAWIGLRSMLARFPWQLSWIWNCRSVQAISDEVRQRTFAWPLDQLQGKADHPAVGRMHGLLAGALIGWWFYCLLSLVPAPDRQQFASILPWLIAMICMAVRVGVYVSSYHPPISFWGRLWTLRWIVPRYDDVFVAPLFIYLAARYMPGILAGWNMPTDAAAAGTVALVALLALNMPPSFERWRLTGFHRIVPGNVNKQEFERI